MHGRQHFGNRHTLWKDRAEARKGGEFSMVVRLDMKQSCLDAKGVGGGVLV